MLKILIFFFSIVNLFTRATADSSAYSEALASAFASSQTSNPGCGCPAECPEVCLAVYDPVCAHQNCYRTFGNDCEVQRGNCQLPPGAPKWQIVSKGECEKKPHYSNQLCNCPTACILIYDPLCGYNGLCYKTFSNSCDLGVHNCQNPYNSFVKTNDGECTQGTVCKY